MHAVPDQPEGLVRNAMTLDGVVHAMTIDSTGLCIACPNPYGTDATACGGTVAATMTDACVTCIDCLARPLQEKKTQEH